MQVQALKYGAPDGWARSIPTALGGILEHLRQLSDRLAERYKWTEAQASLFVLTGQIPLISSIYMTLAIHSRPLFSRIVLEIDPASSPSKVAEAYRRGRKEILAARHRNLSEKHLQLALFAAQRPRNETGALKMAEWNKTHPIEWQYKEVANFSHDCLQARRRLLRE